MSIRARKNRIQDLYHCILDIVEGGIIPQERFLKLKAKFVLDHGISERTFVEYIKQFEQIGFLYYNWNEFFNSDEYFDKLDWTDEEIRAKLYWKVNERVKIS